MPRAQRIAWELGLYHITVRGNDKQQVFHHARDFNKYLELLEYYKGKFKFKLYAFTLMLNHLHLLIETTEFGNISNIMKPLNQRYSFWHNVKYKKTGHLWENRFYSSIIEKDSYFLECIRYIELNPVRSKLVTDPKHYKWSSYNVHAHSQSCSILDSHPIFSVLGKTSVEIQQEYRKFVSEGI